MAKELLKKISCTLEVLTPVHIGTGEKWHKNIDFYSTKNDTIIVPQHLVFDYLEEYPHKIDAFTYNNTDQTKKTLIAINDRTPKGSGIIEYPIKYDHDNFILPFIRSAYHAPFIPGSSIKGAIRTAIIKHLFSELEKNKKKDYDNIISNLKSKKIDQKDTGTDYYVNYTVLTPKPESKPNSFSNNLMRLLHIDDVFFDTEDLYLDDISTYKMVDDTFDEMSFKQYCETLYAPIELFDDPLSDLVSNPISIGFNTFLQENKQAKKELEFTNILDWNFLQKTCNDFAKKHLQNEIDWFYKVDADEFSTVIQNLEFLYNLINTIQDGFLLNIGWGGGWRSKTGSHLPEPTINHIRKKGNWKNSTFPTFPKTRKVVMFKVEGEEYAYPFTVCGWVKISKNAV